MKRENISSWIIGALIGTAVILLTASFEMKSILVFSVAASIAIIPFVLMLKKLYSHHITKALMISLMIISSICTFSANEAHAETTATSDFSSDTVGSDPIGWWVVDDPPNGMDVAVYDDGGNKRCYLYDENLYEYCGMQWNFSGETYITTALNVTFDVKITQEFNNSYFIVGFPTADLKIYMVNDSTYNREIYVRQYEEVSPHLLGTYELNTWKTLTLFFYPYNNSYSLTDGNNIVWGVLDTPFGENSIVFLTTPEISTESRINASVDNIIATYGFDAPFNVSTLDATIVDWDRATLRGNLTDTGGESDIYCGFQYGTSPGDYDHWHGVEYKNTAGDFQWTLTGLEPETTYYYRAVASKDYLETYGEEKSFTTCTRYGYHEDQVSDQSLTTYFWVAAESWGKQSFKPDMPIITKVQIKVGKSDLPSEPLEIYLLNQSNEILRSAVVNADDITTSATWYEWDINDLFVTPGDTYFIKLDSGSAYEDGMFMWSASTTNIYSDGSLSYSTDIPGYDPSGIEDCAFIIYGSANLTASFAYARTNMSITVNATNSSSTPGSIAYYQWDWEGDGTYDDEGITASHIYEGAGTYNVTLKIINNYGDWLTATAEITVENGTSESSSATENSSGSGGDHQVPGTPDKKPLFKIPLSYAEMIIFGLIGLLGVALAMFFLKPESIKALGYAPAAGSILVTILIIASVLLYHMGMEWYWIAGTAIVACMVLYITLKAVFIKKRRTARKIFSIKRG